MRHPPYQLTPNKAVDRLIFMDAIRRLRTPGNADDCSYYSLGGPYLEDCKLVYECFPNMRMVSIEHDVDTYRRQQFHLPCGNLTLLNTDLASFLAAFDTDGGASVLWLDNVGLEYAHFDAFMTALQRVGAGSMIKITLEASVKWNSGSKRDGERRLRFSEKYVDLMPDPGAALPIGDTDLAFMLQAMIRIASERALHGSSLVFQPVSSFLYRDGVTMVTLTGVVCDHAEVGPVVENFGDWELANLDWSKPRRIDLPILTTKERLHLQGHLPCPKDAGRALYQLLGYQIEEGEERTRAQLQQYADYHRYSPYFVRAVP